MSYKSYEEDEFQRLMLIARPRRSKELWRSVLFWSVSALLIVTSGIAAGELGQYVFRPVWP